MKRLGGFAGEDARLARDEHGTHRRVLARGAQRIHHRAVHVHGERVLLLGACDLDGGDAVEGGGLDAHAGFLVKALR
jgi:hypothetical protein